MNGKPTASRIHHAPNVRNNVAGQRKRRTSPSPTDDPGRPASHPKKKKIGISVDRAIRNSRHCGLERSRKNKRGRARSTAPNARSVSVRGETGVGVLEISALDAKSGGFLGSHHHDPGFPVRTLDLPTYQYVDAKRRHTRLPHPGPATRTPKSMRMI